MKGLYKKYIVSGKTNGSPIDPCAEYVVLRVDKGEYVHACRAGVMAFARAVAPLNPELAADLEALLSRYPMGRALVPAGWATPSGHCITCRGKIRAVAHDIGDGWALALECTACGWIEDIHDWPFVVDYMRPSDLEACGFVIL